MKHIIVIMIFFICSTSSQAENGKLLATSGAGPIEGGSGGGLIPWALIGGYTTQDEIGFNATFSEADVKDYTLSSHGLSLSAYDRVELSFAQLRFENKAGGIDIKQNVISAKTRLYGDAVYGSWPLFSVGFQHKTLQDKTIASALGASDTQGTDVYLSAAKIWLNGPLNRTALLNANLRYSKANQLGLLGYGTAANDDAQLLLELAGAVFINRRVAVGMEYRQKPDNINGVKEDDWQDLFIAYFPSKSVSLTLAYLQLGEIAGLKDQDGYYFSLQAAF
tara:strand:- start:1036 stop:1869 length:834 start_codon:yes stop_codon:yes gene_type:complete